VGLKIEEEFTNKAKQAGLTEEEAHSAFNSNMMATGLLSETPAGFAKEHNRRWLVSAYEAGDVVLHKPHTVGHLIPFGLLLAMVLTSVDSCLDHQQ
jgi:phytanoyl-CoA hydroxylase